MKIAHFIETETPGGAEKLLLDICTHTRNSGHVPAIIHFNHAWFSKICEELDIEQIIIQNNTNFKKTLRLPLFALEFRKLLKSNNIDILHSHLFGPIVGGALGAYLARVPHVGTIHDIYMMEEKPSRIRLLQLAAFLNSRLVTVSQDMEQHYRKLADFSKRSLRTIYNTVKDPTKLALKSKSDVRENLAVSKQSLLLVAVGRLVALKKYEDLLRAIEILGDEIDLTLCIAGDGPELPRLTEQVATTKLSSKVKLLGRTEDVYSLLSASDVYLQCSETEGLSLSIMEALACSLPCIVTNVGSNHEMVSADNGLLVGVGEPQQIANAIRKLAFDKEKASLMAQASRKRYLQMFSYEERLNEYINLYKEIEKIK